MAVMNPTLPVRAVVFDLDGTLIDSRGDIAASCNHALQATGRPTRTLTEVSALVGDGGRTLLSRAAGVPEDSAALDELYGHFLAYYVAHPVDHTRLLPHAEATLEALQGAGFRLALCTNKPRVTTDAVIDALGIGQWFTAVVAGDDLPTKKPDPGPLEALALVLRLVPAELVMVGDGPQDVLAGKAVGCRTVGLRGGFLPIERLLAAGPDVLLDDLSTLPRLVQSWAESTVIARPRSSPDSVKR
jgi:phosphoglycolate phosphatase